MNRRFHIVAAALVVGVTVGLFWGALFRGETFAHRDLGAFYRPAKSILVPLARASGGVPQWNPLFASGQPFAANPEHEIFHPMTALLFVLPFEWAFRCQVILPPAFAVLAMFALLRTLRRSRAAALFGGLSWGFGGYLLSTSNLLPILFAVAALPLVVLFAVRLTRERRATDLVGLAATFALVALAGEPSTLLCSVPLVAAAVVAERGRAERGLALSAAGLALGAALAGAALLPGLHHASQTLRAGGLPAAVVDQWSLPPLRVAELVAPQLLGHVDEKAPGRYWGRSFYPGREFPFLYSLYPGLLGGLLAIAAFIVRRRTLWPWLVVAGLGYLAALGNHFFLWHLLRKLPLLSGIRFPEKLSLLFVFPATVAAAYGFDQLRLSRRPLLTALAAFAAAGLLAAAALAVFRPGALPTALVTRDALRITVVALAFLALLALLPQGRLALCVLAALDLGTAGKELVPSVPLAQVARPPAFLAGLVASGQDHLLFHLAAWDPKLSQLPGLAKPPVPAQWGLALTLETDFDLTQLRWTPLATDSFWKAIERDRALMSPLLRRRGVDSLLRFRQDERGKPALEVLSAGDAQPFAFAAKRVEIAGDWVAQVARLGEDAAVTAIVEPSELPSFPTTPASAEVKVVARTPMYVSLDVVAQGVAFVAINQTWARAWRATIDGAPARLLRTDVALSGLPVPGGRHRVELTYDDPWIRAGQIVSAAAALACLAVLLARRRR